MKYLVILYAQYNDDKADKKAIYEATSNDDVVATFHGYMSTYMKDKTVKKVTVLAINEDGGIIRDETWSRTEVIEEVAEVTE